MTVIMDLEQAKEIYFSVDPMSFVFSEEGGKVVLDGTFTVAELEAIVCLAKEAPHLLCDNRPAP